MKIAHVLLTVLAVHSLAGCNKPSERYRGVEKQPAYPAERNPATLPTAASGSPEASTVESEGMAPAEDPDTPGTTRTPATADGVDKAGAQ